MMTAKKWHFMRVLRLLPGLLMITQGVAEKDWLIVAIGLLFAWMQLSNRGCCPVPITRKQENKTYEETNGGQ